VLEAGLMNRLLHLSEVSSAKDGAITVLYPYI